MRGFFLASVIFNQLRRSKKHDCSEGLPYQASFTQRKPWAFERDAAMRAACDRPGIEIIDIQHMNDLHKKVEDGDVRLRYLIDMAP